MTTKTHTFEKALVSTGPETDKERTKEKKKDLISNSYQMNSITVFKNR